MLAIGGKPGEAYTPSAWEWYFEAERFRDPLDPEAALRLMDEANERFPDHVGVMYSTACWLALAGRTDEALGDAPARARAEPKTREWAKDDEDLAAPRPLDDCGLACRTERRSRSTGTAEAGAAGGQLCSPETTLKEGLVGNRVPVSRGVIR